MKSPKPQKQWTLRLLISVFALVAILTFAHPSRASYYMQPAAESYRVPADNWKVVSEPSKAGTKYSGNEIHAIEVVRGNTTYKFPIDGFRLVEGLNSDAICTGGGDEVYKKAIDELKSLGGRTAIQLVLVSMQANGPLLVAGYNKADINAAYEVALQRGSQTLNISARQIHALKGKDEYAQKIRALHDANWAIIAKPVRVTSVPKPTIQKVIVKD